MINCYNIVFLGQTGYGKSSLINCLFGTNFNTNPLLSCTKELYSVSIINPDNRIMTTVFDTPGIGEYSDNSIYMDYYINAVKDADCIVLVVSMDRTDSTSQDLLEQLRSFIVNDDVKFIIALNRIDSKGIGGNDRDYSSWNTELNIPTIDAQNRIDRRIKTIRENYDGIFLPFQVVPVCAIRKYGISELYEQIMNHESWRRK